MKKNNQLFVVIVMIAVFFSQFAGDVNAQQKITFKASSSNGTISVFDPNLDKIWKPDFIHAIVIPDKASIKSYCDMMKKLENSSIYKKSNTIVFCSRAEESRAKEIAASFTIFVSDNIPPKGEQEIGIFTIQKKKVGEYDYQLVRIKD